jgi:DNA repair protein RadC
MPLKMKELPETERPYEKLKMYGEFSLSNAELLAIIIKTGTKEENSVSIANRILLLGNSLADLQNVSIENLKSIKGIGEIKAIQIKAICELAKRMLKPINSFNICVTKPKDIADLLMNELKFEKQEIVKVILLNNKNMILKIKNVVIGETNFANVTIKQILTEAIKMQVNKFILVHNHPSGDPTPSIQDYELTKKVVKASEIMGIQLLDHIVIGDDKYESIFSRREFKDGINGI